MRKTETQVGYESGNVNRIDVRGSFYSEEQAERALVHTGHVVVISGSPRRLVRRLFSLLAVALSSFLEFIGDFHLVDLETQGEQDGECVLVLRSSTALGITLSRPSARLNSISTE